MPEHYFSEKPSSRSERGLVTTVLRGISFEFVTDSGVFSHRRVDNGTRLLVESMVVPSGGRLLDLGCGYGVVGIAAARLDPGLDVWMTDVNERAAALAEENAARGGVKATVRRGSFYEPVDEEKFDVIVTNPPISAGMARVVEPMISGAPAHLKSGGSLQLVVQSNKGGRTVEGLLGESFGSIEVLARGGGYRVFRATA